MECTTQSKTVVVTPFGATKRSKKHSVSGTARKRTLKGIAKTTIIQFIREQLSLYNDL